MPTKHAGLVVLTISSTSMRRTLAACAALLTLTLPVVGLAATRATGAAPALVDQQLDSIVGAGAAPPNLDELVAPVDGGGSSVQPGASRLLEVEAPGGTPRPIAESAFLPGASRDIPRTVLVAYHRAADDLAASDPSCKLPWWLLAGIGRIESGHAAGGHVDRTGTTVGRILGPRLDGSTPGTAVIADTDRGALDGDPNFDRAVGPMQFLPATWAAVSSDGNGDGRRDPHNIFDAALGTGRYLCAGGARLDTDAGMTAAVLRYNQSDTYVRDVLAWGRAYRDGATPIADPAGPIPVAAGPSASAGASTRPPTPPTSTRPRASNPPSPSPTTTGTAPPATSPTASPTAAPTGAPGTGPSCPPSSSSSTPTSTPTTTETPTAPTSSATSTPSPSPTATGAPGC